MDGPDQEAVHTIPALQELRLECNGVGDVYLTLEDGSAEVFGAELLKGDRVNVRGQKLAVFTWTGCRVKREGEVTLEYVSEDTPNSAYVNLHTQLNLARETAKEAGTRAQAAAQPAADGAQPPLPPEAHGPRVVIVGPTDSGKSTLSKQLLNWAVRSGWEPTFVDLDVGQGSITTPGCIAAVPIEQQLDIEEGAAGLDMPLVYWYGHTSASDNPELYKFLVDRLAAVLAKRSSASVRVASSGTIINTLGWVEGLGYELQVHAIQALKADIIVVLEQDRLYTQLATEFKGYPRPVQVLKLPKSGGVVKREKDDRRGARDARVREYFYGVRGGLNPVMQTVPADKLLVFKVGGGPRAPTSALPIGAVATADPLRVSHCVMSPELMQGVLAVSHAATPDLILSTNVAGFILIRDIDVARGTVTYLAPCPGALPGRYLVAGSLRTAFA